MGRLDAEELSTVANKCEWLQAIDCGVFDASGRGGHIIDDNVSQSAGREGEELDEDEVVVQEYLSKETE